MDEALVPATRKLHQLPPRISGREVSGPYKDICTAPEAWHVRDKTPESVRQLDRVRQLEMRQQRCTVDLGELERQWREKANKEMAGMLAAQAEYDEFKALPLIVLPD